MNDQFQCVIVKDGLASVEARYKTARQLKVVIGKEGRTVSYDVENGKEQIQPLTFGGGTYDFKQCEQLKGNQYTVKAYTQREVKPENGDSYMIKANTYIPFSPASPFYETAKQQGSWEKIYKYMTDHFYYDYVAALLNARKKLGVPDINACWQKKRGFCYDLCALAVAMARACGIPAALVIGKVNGNAHAWVEVNGRVYDITKAVQKDKRKFTYTEERRM